MMKFEEVRAVCDSYAENRGTFTFLQEQRNDKKQGINQLIEKPLLLVIHVSTNQIAILDCNAFLSESESRNLSLLYHFGGDST